MANPKPSTEQIAAHQYVVQGDEPLGAPISIRFPASVDAVLRAMPSDERSQFIRGLVMDAIKNGEPSGLAIDIDAGATPAD